MSLNSIPGTLCYYEIQLAGQLSQEIAEWFGMTLTVKHVDQGTTITILSGQILDQSALFGILNRIRDLGLKLISVNRLEPQLEQH
jgi:hypothetical protein